MVTKLISIHYTMKRTLILAAIMALGAVVNAQMTYRVVYIPGEGEHQFGFNLAPSFPSQHLGVGAEGVDAATNSTFSYDVNGMMTNVMGVSLGMFYGYETVDNTLNWGNYVSLAYGVNPFSGEVTLTHNGVSEKHKVSLLSQQVQLHFNPFLAYRISNQLSVSLGVGLCIAPLLPSKVTVDGQAMQKSANSEASILMSLLNSCLDANAGVKYWFSDDMYVGLRLQYAFFNALGIFGNTDSDDEDLLEHTNGALKFNLDEGTGRYSILPVNHIQAVLSVGFVW